MATKVQDSTPGSETGTKSRRAPRSRKTAAASSSAATDAATPKSEAAKPAAAKPAARKRPATKRAAPKAAGNRGVGKASMIGMAAAGLAAGIVANLGRKAAVQAPSALAGDWFEALKGEHKAALALFDAILKTSDSQTLRRAMLLMQLKHALGKHAFTEENVIYPALRDAGDAEVADKLNHDHGYVKQHLYDLDAMAKDAPGFLPLVSKFRAELESHISTEESEIFPALHARLSEEKNLSVTRTANKEGFKIA
jgi:hemerythrin superfamily protein